MPIEDIVSVTITTETARVAKANFGIPLIAAYHSNWGERVRSYSASTALSAMVLEGFTTASPAYKAMTALLSQNPRCKTVKIGRRSTAAWAQVVDVTPGTPGAGEKFDIMIDGVAAATFTADGTPTLAEACTGIASAINAIAGVTVTASGASGTHVAVTSNVAGLIHNVQYVPGKLQNFSIVDSTPQQSIATDLGLIRAADSDWYGLVIDSPSTQERLDAAAWSETQTVIFASASANTDIIGSGTTDLFHGLKVLGYARTIGLYHPVQNSFAGAAWLGKMLPFNPGAATWAYKSLAGVAVTDLTPTQVSNIEGKSGNDYVSLGGVSITKPGQSFANEFIDVTIFVDWLKARIQERIFGLIVNRPKLPYTDESVDLIRAQILAQLFEGVAVGGLAAGKGTTEDPSPTVEAPLVADVSPTDRANRLLPDVTFSARLAGAIHTIDIQGNLTV